MNVSIRINRLSVAGLLGLALSGMLTPAAFAGGPLGYQFTDITNAQLGTVKGPKSWISNAGRVGTSDFSSNMFCGEYNHAVCLRFNGAGKISCVLYTVLCTPDDYTFFIRLVARRIPLVRTL